MSEIFYPQPNEVTQFLKEIDYSLPEGASIHRIFPGYFAERRVFSYKTPVGLERVVKLRPADDKAQRELRNMQKLETSYRFSGTHFSGTTGSLLNKGSYFAMDMPYLGESLTDLSTRLDLVEFGDNKDDTFRGFTKNQIDSLFRLLERDHTNFVRFYGLIHGDIFQHGAQTIFFGILQSINFF